MQKKEQLQDIENRIEKIYDALETGKLPVELISSRLKELTNQKKSLEIEISDLEIQSLSQYDIPFSLDDIEKELRKIPQMFESGTMEEKRTFLRSIISQIIVTDDDIHIEYSQNIFG
ncbi:MAG: hypothetical protein ACE5PV_01830 [Candidatus Poribacteria bacterium]